MKEPKLDTAVRDAIYNTLRDDCLSARDNGLTVDELVKGTGISESRIRRCLQHEEMWPMVVDIADWRDSFSTSYKMMLTGTHRVKLWKLSRRALILMLRGGLK